MCYGYDGEGALRDSLERRGASRRSFLRGSLATAAGVDPLVPGLAGMSEVGGVVHRLPDEWRGEVDRWGPAPPGMELMAGIKEALDPRRVLSPGRFVGGL